MDFVRFPHTPHLAWLGHEKPRDDKILSPDEARELLAHEVLVEEKLDGANVGFSVDEQGEVRVQNRGKYLSREQPQPQFKPLFRWLAQREQQLAEMLSPNLMLFGEWCYAVHSVRYSRLPDWFLAFDVYDREGEYFWSTDRRDALATDLALAVVPRLGKSLYDMASLKSLLRTSEVGDDPAEGIYVRQDAGDRLVARAKLVRPDFAQAIDQHWTKKALQSNTLAASPRAQADPA